MKMIKVLLNGKVREMNEKIAEIYIKRGKCTAIAEKNEKPKENTESSGNVIPDESKKTKKGK